MGKTNQLTPRKIASLKAPGKYADGLGLYLLIRREGDGTGDRSWCFRFMRNGQARQLGLGALHSVSLQEARNRARQARQCILDGGDPIEIRREASAAIKVEKLKTLTFKQAAEQFLETERVQQFRNETHRRQWRSTLEAHAFPILGDLPLQSIDSAIILNCLLPVYRRTWETAYRTHGRVERVFRWAIAHKLFTGENPGAFRLIKDALPGRPKAAHHKAMPYQQVPQFIVDLRQRNSISAKALEFLVLTATRTSETINATWGEIDLDAALWVVPGQRMKSGRDFRVPLSSRAVEILRGVANDQPAGHLAKATASSDFVFTNGTTGKALSNMALLELLRGAAGNGFTTHGMRSAFSDWARDQTAYARDVVELALAHSIRDKSEAAYRRQDALTKRARLMSDWAKFCASPIGETATVYKIGKGAA